MLSRSWDRVVVEVALYDRLEPFPGLWHGIMHAHSELLLDLPQLRLQALADRHASYREPAIPILRADMRESQKVKRLRLTFSSPFPIFFGESAEFYPARFYLGGALNGELVLVGGEKRLVTRTQYRDLAGPRQLFFLNQDSWY